MRPKCKRCHEVTRGMHYENLDADEYCPSCSTVVRQEHEAEIATLREQRDRLLKACTDTREQLIGDMTGWWPGTMSITAARIDEQLRDAIAYAESQGSEMDKTALLGEQRNRLLAACRDIEWTNVLGEDVQRCPSCGMTIAHHPQCALSSAIAYAEGRTI